MRSAIQDNQLQEHRQHNPSEDIRRRQLRRSTSIEVEVEVSVPAELRSLYRLDSHDADRNRVLEAKHHICSGARFLLDTSEQCSSIEQNITQSVCRLTLVTPRR